MSEILAHAKIIKNFTSTVDNGRGHSIIIDLPIEKGGEDKGPTALELTVMGLAGCISTIYTLISKKRKVEIENLEVEVKALPSKTRVPFSKAIINVKVKSRENLEDLEKIMLLTMRTCPVGSIFSAAGIEINMKVEKYD